MKKLILIFTSSLIVAFSLFTASFAATNNISLLFVQTSQDAKIIPQKNNHYVLKLQNVDKYVSYFSDRPSRVTGLIKTENFINFWHNKSHNQFAVTPPNVAIESAKIVKGKERHIRIFASLANPVYDAKNHTLTYKLILLDKNKTHLDKMDLGYTVVFFDNLVGHWNPDGL